jgi:ribosomal protein L40E
VPPAREPQAVRRPRERAETRSVKVCPHCAEELPDEATACTKCHQDPAEAPAWATPRRPDESQPWWSEDVLQKSRDSGMPDNVPAPYGRMEPATARGGSLGIPSKVWASIILGFGWGFVAGVFAGPLPLGARLVMLPLGYVVGLIVGNLGRAEVADSDRLGKILAIVGIGLNAFGLITSIFSLIPFGLVRGVG